MPALAPPHRVLIVRKPGNLTADTAFQEIHAVFEENDVLTVVDPSIKERATGIAVFDTSSPEENDIDLVITIGGDDSPLYVSQLFKTEMPPILSFNIDTPGFLSPFTATEAAEVATLIVKGELDIVSRTRLQCTITRQDKPEQVFHIMNQVTVDRGVSQVMIHLECFCDDEPMTTVQGDGVIIATPTGSTQYNLSAGGTAVHPAVSAMLFTPICPRSLSFRPVTLPGEVSLDIAVPETSIETVWITIDGWYRLGLRAGASVNFTGSPYPLTTVCRRNEDQDWFRSLRECLNWNTRKIQKAFNSQIAAGKTPGM